MTTNKKDSIIIENKIADAYRAYLSDDSKSVDYHSVVRKESARILQELKAKAKGEAIGIKLDGKTYKQIQEALMDAFPSYNHLEMMVRFTIDENLDKITSSQNDLSVATFNLIKWVNSRGKLLELIEGACNENSDNELLKLCYQEICNKSIDPQ